ncbi:MAG: hypothetical protein CMQ20_13645 [Gammaproteobacteria bacterium]|nr:hypothetical protein [Gammaproteobacteria bacterium]
MMMMPSPLTLPAMNQMRSIRMTTASLILTTIVSTWLTRASQTWMEMVKVISAMVMMTVMA